MADTKGRDVSGMAKEDEDMLLRVHPIEMNDLFLEYEDILTQESFIVAYINTWKDELRLVGECVASGEKNFGYTQRRKLAQNSYYYAYMYYVAKYYEFDGVAEDLVAEITMQRTIKRTKLLYEFKSGDRHKAHIAWRYRWYYMLIDKLLEDGHTELVERAIFTVLSASKHNRGGVSKGIEEALNIQYSTPRTFRALLNFDQSKIDPRFELRRNMRVIIHYLSKILRLIKESFYRVRKHKCTKILQYIDILYEYKLLPSILQATRGADLDSHIIGIINGQVYDEIHDDYHLRVMRTLENKPIQSKLAISYIAELMVYLEMATIHLAQNKLSEEHYNSLVYHPEYAIADEEEWNAYDLPPHLQESYQDYVDTGYRTFGDLWYSRHPETVPTDK